MLQITLAAWALSLTCQDPVSPDPPTKLEWGRIEWKQDAAILYIDGWPAEGKVVMPRLNNPIGTVYLLNDPAKTALGFQPNVGDWAVILPKVRPADPVAVVVEVKGRPRIAKEPVVVEPGETGSILLAAHTATPHGKVLRYEPQPHKNTLGYWVDAGDWCEWHFRASRPGTYRVTVLQGCGKGQGGSSVMIQVAGQALDYTVEDTGHFQNFVERTAGTVKIEKPEEQILAVRAVKKAKAAVMDLREVRLTPEP